MSEMFPAFVASLMLSAAHMIAGHLKFLSVIPRSRWLSFASGISVTYVFIHLLPELGRHQRTLRDTGTLAFAENHVYLLALFGLVAFYGLERAAKTSRRASRSAAGVDRTPTGVFVLHMASFAVYNSLIGYLVLHREEPGLNSLVFFTLAMTLHFLVNDFGLQQDHKGSYERIGRWVLASAVWIGFFIGVRVSVSPAALALLFSFLAGGIILNVMKEELPEERESRFSAFVLGASAYAVLLYAAA